MKKLQIFIIFCVFSVVCYAQTSRPVVSNISAQFSNKENVVLLSWSVPTEVKDDIKELHIFRNEGQFITSPMLDSLVPIAIVSSTINSYSDTNTTNGNYYYAVVAKMNNGTLYDVIMPTRNATTSAIKVSSTVDYNIPVIEKVDTSDSREKPLANIELFAKEEESTSHISSDVLASTSSLVKSQKHTEKLEPVLLNEELKRLTRTQDDAILLDIIDSFLATEDWLTLKQKLESFLSSERTEHSECRAWFYLGQIAYLQEDYRLAIRYFQYAQQCYPVQARKWIDESLMLFEMN